MLAEREAARLQSAQARLIAAAADQPIAPPTASAPASAPAAPAAPAVPPPAASRRAAEALNVSPGGLGEFPATEISPVPTAAPAQAPAPAARSGQGLGLTPAEQRYADLLDPTKNPDMFKLPEAINYDEFIQAAGQEEAAIRAAAKQEALGAALVQLGAGLAAGNMAAGFSEAGTQAQQIMKEGRRDASAQKALAQELKLRGMEGKRDQQLKQMEMNLGIAAKGAEFEGGLRRDRQNQANEERRIALQAAQHAAQLAQYRTQNQINQREFEIATRAGIEKSTVDYIKARIGDPPTKLQEEWASRPDNDPMKSKVSPMEAYMNNFRMYEPEARKQAAAIYGVTLPSAPPASSSSGPSTRGRGKNSGSSRFSIEPYP